MIDFKDLSKSLSNRLIEVAATPDLAKLKVPEKLTLEDFPKIISPQIALKKPWLGMRYDRETYLIASGMFFVYSDEQETVIRFKEMILSC